MNLQIEFYEKYQVSVHIEYEQSKESEWAQSREHALLLMYAWYVLRQLNNMGQHPVAKALSGLLAGLLVTDEGVLTLLHEPLRLSQAYTLHRQADALVYAEEPDEDSRQRRVKMNAATYMSLAPLFAGIDRQILSVVPTLVQPTGRPGKKRMLGRLPAGLLDIKGLGILGIDANYYVFHSVLALLRYFAVSHQNNTTFLNQLGHASLLCAVAYVKGQIGRGAAQARMAWDIVDVVKPIELE
ncbi:MAG: hypothetical protein HYR71_12375 [Chloroflexi bacterium]|nr:hypothetical protein [Chloroflexota bacterium]